MKKSIFFSLCFFAFFFGFGNVRVSTIFSDHMVLQRNKTIPVWGWADPNENVIVEFNQQSKSVKADSSGKWMVHLDPEKAGGPFKLIIKAGNKLTFRDILVGEVWICSGQSNMEFMVKSVADAETEIAEANYPQIRHFIVPKDISAFPKDELTEGHWDVCSPETIGDFTAVGYFFAREIFNEIKIPIGLINATWGGTVVETWTSKNTLERNDDFKDIIAAISSFNQDSLIEAKKRASEKYLSQLTKKIESLQGSVNNFNDVDQWMKADYDDSNWPHMKLPGLWEKQVKGLKYLDGSVWFRKDFTLGRHEEGKPGKIHLAMIDDNDWTYINGVPVGSTFVWNQKRIYEVPGKVLKNGKNVVAVRAEDGGGGGGIYGNSADMKIIVNRKQISLAGEWSFKVDSMSTKIQGLDPNDFPCLLYNAMINPVISYAMQGVIWYQGESNAARAFQYRKAFPMLIRDWRDHWAIGDFPFYFVQLASFNEDNGNSKNGSTWAELREAQLMTLSLPNTGMAVTTDIGDSVDIHPRNKLDVGKRLAAVALKNVYGKNIVCCSPLFKSMEVKGNRIILSFFNTGSGLMANDKYGYLKGFEIAGADSIFHFAKAFVEGGEVIVFSDSVNEPVAVRYGWADNAGEDNLYNKDGYPASPFRTDQWKGITEEEKYTVSL
ncbi:MAG: sialate O-acetylesterase [Bacteroidota bacterium]